MRDETSDPITVSGFQPENTDSASVTVPSANVTVVSAGVDEFIQISDPSMLFLGDYDRQGENLVVSHEGQTHVIDGYFGSENLPALQAPNGAFLTGDTVATLAGLKFGGQFAQAGGGEPVEIGKVIKLDGTATSTSAAGVRTDLEVGTPVYQGDVIETGTGSKLGITFVDKTVFSMSAGARMVLDELVYDPNSVADSSMSFNLVQGAFVFVTGDIAPTGNMKIDTPVATMGIRGTTPKLLIDTTLGITEFSILPDPDSGDVGSYVILNKVTGAVLGTVAATADKWIVTTLANEAVRINKTGLDLLEDQLALDEIRDVFTLAAGDRASLDGSNSFTRIAFNPLGDGGPGVEATDGFGGPADGSGVVVDANPLSDDPPEAADDEFQTDLRGSSDPADTGDFDGNIVVFDNGQGVDIDPEGFPINVTEINGQPLAFDQPDGTALVTVPSGATLNVEPDGTIIYNPNTAYDFLGDGDQDVDTFNYTIADVGGQTDVGQIDVTLIGRNERPEIIFDTGSIAPLTSPFGEALTFGETSASAIFVDTPSFPVPTDLDEAFTELGTTGDTATERSVSGVMNFRDLDASDTHTTSQAAPTVVWTQDDGGTESLGEIGQLALSISATEAVSDPKLSFTLDEPPVLVERPAPIDGTVEWTYTVTEADVDFLAVGETLTLTYPVSVTDNSGVGGAANADGSSTATEDVTIVITGTNDGPQVTDQTKVTDTLTETNEGLTTTGSFDIIDVDTTDVVSVTGVTVVASGEGAADAQGAVPSDAALDAMFSVATDATPQTNQEIDGSSNTGTVNWTFDSGSQAFDYLAVGEQLVLTYTVTIEDDNGAPTTQDVVITIEGTNDTPIVTEEVVVAETLAETDEGLSVTGSFNLANVLDADTTDFVSVSNIDVETSGQNTDAQGAVPSLETLDLMFTIVETGTQESEEIDNTANLGQVKWQFDSGNEAFDYLAVGESLILTYTLTISDDNNASVDQDVVITITGTNDDPDMFIDTVAGDTSGDGVTETNAALTASGTVSLLDVDVSNTVDVVVTKADVLTSGGTPVPAGLTDALAETFFSIDANPLIGTAATEATITWEFESEADTFDYLAEGEQVLIQYRLDATDSDGGTDAQAVTITVTGTNDAPVLTIDGIVLVTEDVAVSTTDVISTSGTFSVVDVDASDTHGFSALPVGDTTWTGGNLDPTVISQLQGGFFVSGTGWTFNVDNSAIQFLGAGESITLSFDVSANDGSGAGNATDTERVTLTINGTNDAPVVTVGSNPDPIAEGDAGIVSEESFNLFNLLSEATDVDASDTPVVDGGNVSFAFAADSALPTGSTATSDPVGFTVSGTGNDTEVTVDTGLYDSLASGEQAVIDVTFNVNSGDDTVSRTVQITIDGANDAVAPVLTSGASPLADYTQGDGAVVVDSAIALSDADNSTIIGATVQIGAGFVSRYDGLGFVAQNGITGNYNASTGTLTLSGAATVAEYQTALQSVTFGVDPLASTQFGATPPVSPNDFPLTGNSTREISFTVTDGTSSNTAQTTFDVTAASTTPTNGNDVLKPTGAANVAALDGNDIIIVGADGNSIEAGAGNDFISSEGGDDYIEAGDGNDFISGGGGFDEIEGGTGADTFFFFNGGLTGSTLISDYNQAEGDVLDLSALLDDAFDPNAPEFNITIEATTEDAIVSVNGTEVVVLQNLINGDTVDIVYDTGQPPISMIVSAGGGTGVGFGDTLTGTDGVVDTFDLNVEDPVTVVNYSESDGDELDLTSFLGGFDSDDAADLVEVTSDGSDTTVVVDSIEVATLVGFTGPSVDVLYDSAQATIEVSVQGGGGFPS